MDVFGLRDRLVADYQEFTRSFITAEDPRIEEVMDRELAEGSAVAGTPDPAQSLVRARYHVDELVDVGTIQAQNKAIFRRDRTEGALGATGRRPLRLPAPRTARRLGSDGSVSARGAR